MKIKIYSDDGIEIESKHLNAEQYKLLVEKLLDFEENNEREDYNDGDKLHCVGCDKFIDFINSEHLCCDCQNTHENLDKGLEFEDV